MIWSKAVALRIGLACAVLIAVVSQAVGEAAQYFKCNDGFGEERFLQLGVRNGKPSALLGKRVAVSGGPVLATCGFIEGLTFKERISEKDVVFYSGFFDHCSQGQALLFNKKSRKMMLLRVFTFERKSFQCEPTAGYGK